MGGWLRGWVGRWVGAGVGRWVRVWVSGSVGGVVTTIVRVEGYSCLPEETPGSPSGNAVSPSKVGERCLPDSLF